VTLKKKLRDVSFRKRVLTAYSFRCSICGIQLNLVESAHIIPVQYNGTEETSNGLALCPLHHKAYDSSLITVGEDYRVRLNDEKVSKLKQAQLDDGLEGFESNLRPIIHLSPAISDRPHVEYIKQANQIRGWV
jgi:putative restriction endonuclease